MTKYNIEQLVSLCAYTVCGADGNISDSELEVLRKNKFLNKYLNDEYVEIFQNLIAEDKLIDTLKEDCKILEGESEKFKINLIDALIEITIADGEVDDTELLIQQIVAESIGIDSERLNELISSYYDRNSKKTKLEKKSSKTSSSEVIAPFKVSKENYSKAVLEWLIEGDYTPDDILEKSNFEQINGTFLPLYVYSGKYQGSWSASSGYYRTEYYREWDSSAKKYREKSRVVTDWRPSNGNIAGEFSLINGFGGNKKEFNHIISFTNGFKFKKDIVKTFSSESTSGFILAEFKLSEDESWNSYAKSKVDKIWTKDLKGRIPGDRHKDLHSDIDIIRNKAIRAYIPHWIVNYKYTDQSCYVCMDGTDKNRITGKKPEDKNKKKQAESKLLKGHISLVLLLISFLLQIDSIRYDLGIDQEPATLINFFFGLITLIVYLIGSSQKKSIIVNSKAKRKNSLKKYIGKSLEDINRK